MDGRSRTEARQPPGGSSRRRQAASLQRVVIENVRPEVDGGRFPAKAIVGRPFEIEADAFAEYEPIVTCVLRYRREGEDWVEIRMQDEPDDHKRGRVHAETARHVLLHARSVDRRIRDMAARAHAQGGGAAGRRVELQIGAKLVADAAWRASGAGRRAARRGGRNAIDWMATRTREGARLALSDQVARLMARYPGPQPGGATS